MVHTAEPDDIAGGKITDIYFKRTIEILRSRKIDRRVKAEITAKTLPVGWPWAILAGVEECGELLQTLKVSVRGLQEGTVFRPYEPVMELEGMYTDFGIYETALLGLLCQASGIATQAARCKILAGDRTVISFGARRMHPALAPMIERSAFIGGCDGVSVVKGAELIGESPVGTMPHSLILILGDTVEALKAFHEVIDPKIRRVALIDTFGDEKFEAVRAAEALGQSLYAVRLDTPASRRGNFYRILEEVRWELDIRGYRHVKLFVSGGIDEPSISSLNPLVDAYGIGTLISNAPVVDFAMDIVEIDGKPLAKRGKMSGSKRVLRCKRCHYSHTLFVGDALPAHCPTIGPDQAVCPGEWEELSTSLIGEGKRLDGPREARRIREYVLQQLEHYQL